MRAIMVLIVIAIAMGMAATAPLPPANPKVTITGLTLTNDGRTKSEVDMKLQNVLLLKLDTLYKGRLATTPTLAGEIKIKMSINGDGSVTDIKVLTDTTGSKEFPKQVISTTATLTFDPATRDLDVSYTITFSTGEPAPAPEGGTK